MNHPSLAALATPGGPGVAAPLALRAAARIQEREWDEFLRNPTQLANGCRDLVDAVLPNAIVVTSPAVLAEEAAHGRIVDAPHFVAALDAVTRLAGTLAQRAAVGVCIPGPSVLIRTGGRAPDEAIAVVMDAGREAVQAGAHLVLIDDPEPVDGVSLATLVNIARFHEAYVAVVGKEWGGALGSTVVALDAAQPTSGLAVTPGELSRETDISQLADWVYDITA